MIVLDKREGTHAWEPNLVGGWAPTGFSKRPLLAGSPIATVVAKMMSAAFLSHVLRAGIINRRHGAKPTVMSRGRGNIEEDRWRKPIALAISSAGF